MKKNAARPPATESNDFRGLGGRWRASQPLRRVVLAGVLVAGILAVVCRADGQHSDVDAQDLSSLPQFTSTETASGHEGQGHHNHAHEFSLASLAEPTGILTLSMVGLTVCLGLLRRVRRLRPRLLLKIHKIVGVCALSSGAIHATIVLLTH
jgi:hypothetical protein